MDWPQGHTCVLFKWKCKQNKAKQNSQENSASIFLPRSIYVRRQDSEPQKGQVSSLPRSGIDLKGFMVLPFINILSNIFISLVSEFIGLHFHCSDIALPFPSSLTYCTRDVLSVSVYQFVSICGAKWAPESCKLPLEGVHIVCTGFVHMHKSPWSCGFGVYCLYMTPHIFFYSSFPLPPSPLWHRTCEETTLNHVRAHQTLASSTSSVKTPQPSDIPCAHNRKDKACLELPCNKPAGESWEMSFKWMKYVFLSWSCRLSKDSSTARQALIWLSIFLF